MEGVKHKQEELIEDQISTVETRVGEKIIPEKDQDLSFEQLKVKYPGRYEHFLDTLRFLKNPENKELASKADHSAKMLNGFVNLSEYVLQAEERVDKTLIPRQVETVNRILGFLERGNTEGHVTLPTGVGKTVIFSKFLQAMTKESGARALVVGPTKIILHQNRWKIDEFGEMEAGAYYGAEKDLSKAVTVTTYASLRNGIQNGDIDPKTFDIIIFDEAHRALGEETVAAIDAFPENVVKIGFTATPEFHEDKTVADLLPIEIDEMSLREGIESNLLAGLKVFLLPTKADISGVERKGKEFDEKIEGIINTQERNALIVRAYKENELFNGKRAVAYCSGRQHAKDMADLFNREGVSAAYVDAFVKDQEREDIFLKYKQGEIKVLCNAEVLIEGFDESEAEVCINAVPTLSRVVAEQRGGRVLRRSKVKDNKIGYIIEVIDEIGQSENTPVLFSEVAGAAEILAPEPEKEEEDRDKIKVTRAPRELSEVEVTNDMVDDPDLIMQLTNRNMRQRFDKIFEYAPKRWVHSRKLAHELAVREGEIRAYAESFKEGNPDWFKRYLTSTDILASHYSPELSDKIRRHFNPDLENMMTPEEYANKHVMKGVDAQKLLKASETLVGEQPIRYEDETYYPEQSYEAAIRKFKDGIRDWEEMLIREAEERLYDDDDRTDEEREAEYWATFDELPNRTKAEDADLPEAARPGPEVPLDEERIIPDEPLVHFRGDEVSKETIEALKQLSPRQQLILKRRFFEDKSYSEIADEFRVTSTNIIQIERKALRLLRHPLRLHLLDNPFETDRDIENAVERDETQKEEWRLEGLSHDAVWKKYQAFEARLARNKAGKEHIGSQEEIFYKKFSVLPYSLLPSHKKIMDDYLYDPNSSKVLKNVLIRGILEKSSRFTPALSEDEEMVALYDIYAIESELRSCQSAIKSGSYTGSDRLKEFEETVRDLRPYMKKYKKHFVHKESDESEDKDQEKSPETEGQ
jgi:RNA polymerase sigma factor (sigma-70 family)